jgi:hypothetical protein
MERKYERVSKVSSEIMLIDVRVRMSMQVPTTPFLRMLLRPHDFRKIGSSLRRMDINTGRDIVTEHLTS